MTTLAQRSFGAGEITPSLYDRVDQIKYTTGARTVRNFMVMRHGGLASRPGGTFVGEVKDSTKKIRFVRFVFNSSQTYVLEFGDFYMRVVQNGSQVTETAKPITGISQANPGVITAVAHGFVTGDEVFVSGVSGMTQINGRNLLVTTLTADTFSVKTKDGSNLDTSAFSAYVSGGSAARIYTLVTPYAYTDLPILKFAQSGDTITLTHATYPPQTLSRLGNASWTIAAASFTPAMTPPDGGSAVAGGAGSINTWYQVTAVSQATSEESLAGKEASAVIGISAAISAVTQASPGAVTTGQSHGLTTGDKVKIAGVVGMTQLNGNIYTVTVTGATTFTIGVDTTGYTAYGSAGTVTGCSNVITAATQANPCNITTGAAHNLVTGDQVYITGVVGMTQLNGNTYTIIKTSSTHFTLGVDSTGYTAYVSGGFAKSGASKTNPCQILSAAHGMATGDTVTLSAVAGMTQLNGNSYQITKVDADRFTLNAIDATAYGAYTGAGQTQRAYIAVIAAAPTTGAPIVLTIPAVSGAQIYNVYKALNGVFGFIGVSNGGSFSDTGFDPDTTDQPPTAFNPFAAVGDYPSAVSYVQQRLALANTNNNTEKSWLSQIGRFKNFTISTPLKDDDSVSFTLAGAQVNAVKHLITLGVPIIFTASGEWALFGDSSGTITPSAINARQHSYCGASDLAPIIIGGTAVFVQARGSLVRDLAYDWQVSGYRGNDLTIFSAHLVDDGYSIVDWDYAQIPNSIVWMARSDGKLLGMTYVREQQLLGWHRHDFDGVVENVCCVPEGSYDAVYLCIKRTINGRSVRYIERMATRYVDNIDILSYIGMDCALSYDGRNTDGTKTMALSGGTLWDNGEPLTLTASAANFTPGDVGNQVQFPLSDGTALRCDIIAYTSSTVVTVMPQKAVPVSLRGVATSSWNKALKTVSGLFHLEGKSVSALGDGFVLSNPNNPAYTVVTVTGGAAVFDRPTAVIHVGLPVTCDVETLDIDILNGETLADKKKLITKVTASLQNSRGLWVAGKTPAADVIPTDGSMTELKIRGAAGEGYDDPIALATDQLPINLNSSWNSNGRIFLRQSDPLPLTILGVAPAGLIPIRPGG